jgi:hypothetical protein
MRVRDEPLRIKQRAGHRSFQTTEGYIREAENLREGFGKVFQTLPSSLLEKPKPNRRRVSASVSAFGSVPIAPLARNAVHGVEAPGIEGLPTRAQSSAREFDQWGGR